MKNFTVWLKANWLLVVLGVVAIAALPAALFVSMGMSSKFRAEVAKALSDDYTAINSNKVGYYVSTLTGERKLEANTEVNPVMTEAYSEAYERLNAKGAEAAQAGESFNKSDHVLLIDGFFPSPDRLVEATKRTEFLRRYSKSFHETLLERIGAGMPPNPAELNNLLQQHVASHMERLRNERGNEEMNDAEKLRLQSDLFAIRLRGYKARAAEIAVYGDLSAFDGVSAIDPTMNLTMIQAWDLQERAWLHSDVVKAIGRANGTDAGSKSAGVSASVVKRLIRVVPERAGYEGGGVAPADPGTDRVQLNFGRSVTGRVSGPGSQNKWYDLRVVTLEFVASSRRLPEFIDALAATNYITILELDLNAVDVFEELKSGFFYGDEHVVRVTMKLEAVLLRSWRLEHMPVDVKKALGVPVEGETGAGDGGGYTPPPAAPRREELGEG